MNTFTFVTAADGSFESTVARLRELSEAGRALAFMPAV